LILKIIKILFPELINFLFEFFKSSNFRFSASFVLKFCVVKFLWHTWGNFSSKRL